jgi:uroporphyrin-III C-methyltransferase
LAAPAAAGIPLTKRSVNESFWVITGTLSNGQLAHDLSYAAKSTATIIILMGVSQLPEIVSMFAAARSPLEPIAIIQNATCSNQKVVTSVLCHILHDAAQNGIGTPAVIVIGKVVDEHAVIHALELQENQAVTLKR